MREYSRVFKTQLPSLPPRPVLSDYYRPSDEQHDLELAFITIGMISIGVVLYYLEKR